VCLSFLATVITSYLMVSVCMSDCDVGVLWLNVKWIELVFCYDG